MRNIAEVDEKREREGRNFEYKYKWYFANIKRVFFF